MNESHLFSKRTLARKLACDILYQMDLTGDDMDKVSTSYHRMLSEGVEESGIPPGDIPEFARELVMRYMENHLEIDDLIDSYADRWSLQRMPMVDRNLLRLGFTELLYLDI